MSIIPTLNEALSELNIGNANTEKFAKFEQLLLEWNERINLTAITNSFGIMTKHFLDSLLPLTVFDVPQNARMIDVGTGAGFPGIPLKLVRSDISITLLDSLNKRINFLNEVIDKLGLDSPAENETGFACAIHGRAEELGRVAEYREMFDVAASRAVASLDMLSEFCLPFVKVGGVFLALKSADADDETEAAKPVIAELGGEIENEFSVKLPYTEISRKIIVIRKINPTPERFPRSIKKIKRKNLQ